ncbi:NADPH-dependent FMN reductase [Pedobacter montanisoli]|uniref:NAD(P)H-dependent oxidoreductase n=1 Tax=Pedobacter montanisoli TaxID=2923277 RepID=A0ABS9ZZ36_9SPHI|nr:NADPH-dependent FMN reductase [Pedobacter montanisoli]MCJ0743578.1 NAD(P)H-dependent oxidoreductase [Pedobacter montanisoli]
MKNIVAIVGSADLNSANHKLLLYLKKITERYFNLVIYEGLRSLPHFDPQLSISNPPDSIIAFRQMIENADGVIISTPEYVFSLPSGLKNAIEWSVATIIFTRKPLGIVTASASGEKAHEELQLIMETLGATFNSGTTLLIQGIKGKVSEENLVEDNPTKIALTEFALALNLLIEKHL